MKPSKTPASRGRQSSDGRGAAPVAVSKPVAVCPPVETIAEVSRNRALSGKLLLLGLKVDMPAARPGQFVMLGLPQDAGLVLRRPFSVLSQDRARKSVEILYSVEGTGTRVLSAVAKGQRLNLLGPLGRRPFTPEAGSGLRVLVAGGRGIAPLIFLAESMASARKGRSRPVLFLAGARTAEELVLLDRIKATEAFVSTDDGSLGRKGTVVGLLKSLGRELSLGCARVGRAAGADARHLLFGCGPTEMLSALHSYALSEGVPCFVSLEARMACGLGACQGCAVRARDSRYALVCKDGPVFRSDLIDWAQYEGA